MLKAIKKFFDETMLPAGQDTESSESQLQIACTALLLEMARADFDIQHEELQQIAVSVRNFFALSAEDTDRLLELAEQEAAGATCDYEFTSLINQQFSKQDKVRLVEMLWWVAYADEQLQKYEEAMVRKIADLLYVPHSDFIASKHRVLAAMRKA